MQLSHLNNKSQNIGNSLKIYFILKLAKLQVSDSSYSNACIIVVFIVSYVNLYE